MNNPRTFLLVALFALVYLIYSQWQIDYNPQLATPVAAASGDVAATAAANTPVPSNSAEIPLASNSAAANTPAETPASDRIVQSDNPIVVTTDLLRIEIDPRGGSVTRTDLLAYPLQPNQAARVRLLDSDPARYFVAQTGLVSSKSPAPNHEALFESAGHSYALADGQDKLEVPLTWKDASGISVTKTFVFTRGSYVIEQQQRVNNQSADTWTGNAYRQLQRVPLVVDHSGIKGYTNTERYSFIGAAWYSPEDKFQKLAFDKFAKDPVNRSVAGGWIALLQHYFFAAWIPPAGEVDQFTSIEIKDSAANRYLLRSMSPAQNIEPGKEQTFSARLKSVPSCRARSTTSPRDWPRPPTTACSRSSPSHCIGRSRSSTS